MNPTFAACSTLGSDKEAVEMVEVLPCADELRLVAAKELSSSFAALMPDARSDGFIGGDDLFVTRFLLDVAYALSVREAELARLQGISQATQSSWKKRGAIPEPQQAWFKERLVPMILTGKRQALGPFGLGLNVALAIFDQTDFNPYGETFDSRADQIHACFNYQNALAVLGEFVASRLGCHFSYPGHGRDVFDRIAPKTLELARLGRRLVALLPAPITTREGAD